MPIFRTLNQDFFKKWSPQMAYLLGYIAADGTVSIGKRGNCYLSVDSIDEELPSMLKKAMSAGHKISVIKRRKEWNTIYRLQIGSKTVVGDLKNLGIVPKKTKRLAVPKMPQKFFRDFLRGYFDGDGSISCRMYKRTNRKTLLLQMRVLFTSSSERILKQFNDKLKKILSISGKFRKDKNWYRLYYYPQGDIQKIFKFLYGNKPQLFLTRKYDYFRNTIAKINGPVVQSG